MIGIGIIVAEANPVRFRTALTLAAAQGALGARARILLDSGAVGLARTPDPLLESCFDFGVEVMLCQTGLAEAGLDASALDPRFSYGGMVSWLADLAPIGWSSPESGCCPWGTGRAHYERRVNKGDDSYDLIVLAQTHEHRPRPWFGEKWRPARRKTQASGPRDKKGADERSSRRRPTGNGPGVCFFAPFPPDSPLNGTKTAKRRNEAGPAQPYRRGLEGLFLGIGRHHLVRPNPGKAFTMSAMLKISLPDGSVREVAPGTTPADIAAAIGPGLAKAAIAARVDGELRDIMRPLESDATLALVTSRDEKDALELARHDYAHVLAEAVQNLFPGTQITFGPATEDGFYYDFAPKDRPFTDEDLPAIEAEMRAIIARDEKLVREVWSREDLIAAWAKQGETFKSEWARELPEGEELTVYRAGRWFDMCRGPHLASTGKLDPQAFKLTRVSGERDAEPHLRHRLAQQEAARRAPHAARGSGQARPSQDRRGDGPVPPPAGGAGQRLLAPQGLHPVASTGGLYAPPARRVGLSRGQDAAADGRAPVGAVRPLGQISREYVRRPRRNPQCRGRRADPLRRCRIDGAQADELPGARPDLPPGDQVVSRPCRSAWPNSAAATATSRTARCTASCACASSPRTTRISSCARIS